MTLNSSSKNAPASRGKRRLIVALGLLLLATLAVTVRTYSSRDSALVITVWHPMRPPERRHLDEEFRRFEAEHPGVRLQALYKDTEELRSAFQAAVLAGTGPELIWGPSDVLDTFHTMGLLQDMSPWLPAEDQAAFTDGALTTLPEGDDPTREDLVQVGDRFGSHLALVYNRDFISDPPATTGEMVRLAVANTIDEDGDGRKERYGLVWNCSEPFMAIPFLTGFGGWVFAEPPAGEAAANPVPALDTPEAVAAYAFMQQLRDEHQVVPRNCDYELADSLFKAGRAAMIINGDWSWADYLNNPNIDAAVAVLPIVEESGLPMRPMIEPKGFSLNTNASAEAAAAAMAFVRHMTSPEAQQRLVERLGMIPTRRATYEESLATADPTYRTSLAQFTNGRKMPVDTELRAVWDAMKPNYQALLGAGMPPQEAADEMQRDALRRIELMHRKVRPGVSLLVLQAAGVLLLGGWIYWQRRQFARFVADWRKNRVAYLFVLPAIATIFIITVFPFLYNILLSLSNLSLVNYQDWQLVGVQNYVEVLTDVKLLPILLKTIVWTVVSVGLHVAIGLMLAAALNGLVRGRSVYQLLLITPWAVPAYITALTWRGMFDYEYGAVNLMLVKWQQFPPIAWLLDVLGLAAPVNWLGEPLHAFQACIVANVWLGFPFMMIIALGGMQSIPQELYEAARIDGANRWRQFRHVTLPLLMPVLVPAATLAAIWTFNNLNVVWLVSNGGEPQDATHILVSYVYKAVFNLYRYGYGAALSMVIFMFLLAAALCVLGRRRATESVYE